MTTIKTIEINDSNIEWFEISGTDYGTDFDFDDVEIFGITKDNRILDCDGCPLTHGDRLEQAVRNSLEEWQREAKTKVKTVR